MIGAFLACQTTYGTPIRQGMVIFVAAFAALNIASLLLIYIDRTVIYWILSILFILYGYFSFLHRTQSYFFVTSFFVVLLLASLSPIHTADFMRYRIYDTAIGAFIGIISNFILFPVKLDQEFSAGVVPILTSLNNFSRALAASFLSSNQSQEVIDQKNQVEITLKDRYPEWVYEIGFNRGLRSGFRFFLIHIERVIEIYFSLNYLVLRRLDALLLSEMDQALAAAMQKNQELFEILIRYFRENKLNEIKSDFTSDIIELEAALNRLVPNNLELLAVTPNNLLLTALVRDMRDLRELLLQLVKSLPTTHLRVLH
jgi:hypothetical protein